MSLQLPETALIIFIKNPISGHVKTRIGKAIGDEKALEIYLELMHRTQKVSLAFGGSRYLYYSDSIDADDSWDSSVFKKQLQCGSDLGQRMHNALQQVLSIHPKAMIIGSDCPYLDLKDLEEAEQKLDIFDLVVGPAGDGGFYLLALKKPFEALFKERLWSHPAVFKETCQIAKNMSLKTALLRTLWDIDTSQDWNYFQMLNSSGTKR